jgi:hypothetical protein
LIDFQGDSDKKGPAFHESLAPHVLGFLQLLSVTPRLFLLTGTSIPENEGAILFTEAAEHIQGKTCLHLITAMA